MPDEVKDKGRPPLPIPAHLKDRITRCRSCGAPVIWATSGATGSRMILDARPVRGGNAFVAPTGGKLVAFILKEPRSLYERDHMHASHFATCPDADAWRGGRRRPGDSHD